MKKTTLFSISLLVMTFVSYQALTNSGGSPQGRSGSPASNGQTCMSAGCHSGPAASTQTVTITTDIPPSGFVENTDYTITITAEGNGASHSRIGFTASVEESGSHVGTVSTGGNSDIQVSGSYITHTFSGISATGSMRSWSFTWNSGTAPGGTAVYAAVNFTNNNGNTGGDVIISETINLTKASGVGLDENKLYDFNLFPNPADKKLELSNVDPHTKQISIYGLNGQKVAEFNDNSKESPTNWILDVSGLPEGNYIVSTDRRDTQHKNLLIKR